MAILDSDGLKLLTAQISKAYATKDDVAALDTKIDACATKDELADVVKVSALSGFVTVDFAERKFLSIADADNFVEEYQLADFVKNSVLENFLTIDEASKFAEKSELATFVTSAQLDMALENLATKAQVENILQSFAKPNITIDAQDEKIFAFVTVGGKTYKFAVAEV